MLRPPVAFVVAFALVAGACSESATTLGRSAAVSTTTSAVETTATTDTTTPTTDTTVAEPVVEPITWESCGNAECADVPVPLDHDDPGGPTIALFVRRLPATGDRIGALFFNFGGPGGAAAAVIDRFPIPAAVRARFDIVGMDPRGVGRSSRLACGIDPITLYGVDPTIEDGVDVEALLDVSNRYADDCEASKGPVLPHLGTRDVARDMDRIRAGMGDEQLSYVGYSYGTSIGQAYADLFPTRVRSMILDGVVDPAPPGIDVAIEQAQGFETALANWAAGCPSRRSCGFGDDAIGAVDRMLALAEGGVASSNGARALGPGEASVGLAYPLYDQSLWGSLDRAVAGAIDGDGAGMVALADGYLGIVDFSIYFAVSCLDSSWPRSTDEFLARAKAADAVSPRFGEAIVNDYIRCAVWPAEPDPLGSITAPDAPPILVVSTTGDPATPYENGVRVADRLASGVLLTNQGEGHTIVFQGSACIDAAAVAYLVDGTLPDAGARC